MCDEISGLRQQLTAQEAPRPMQQDNVEAPSGSSSAMFTVKLKLEKPPTFDGNPSKQSNWIFLITQFLDIVGINNDNLQAKYSVALFEDKALSWWRDVAGEHAWTPYLGGISVHTWKMSSKILIVNLSCAGKSKG